ncbi:hypothetical protein B0H17DRAFT_57199 [Mycena rosella]|uniref:Uncharacterized protein n=1 Tax=Mycena rosella TaxID=1033263 RepID=A0AAD7GEK0_MYCRO|nr:hypothetical protein B0H17DRAFT_57199 [Mycena rosella]
MSIATTDNSSFLSHCHGFSIYGGTFNHYTAQASSASSTDRDSSGLPIISDDEILPVRQLRQWATYSLHSAEARGTAVVVKVFHGARANRDWHATSAFSRKLIHPSFLRLLGRSTDDSPTRFLVYNSVQGTAQNHLASVLKGSLRECIRVGVDMVHGLSLGLIYLTLHKFPVPCLHAEAFDILVSHTGSIVLGIQSETSISEARSELDEGGWVELLNLLCRKTFNQAGHALYLERDALSTPLPHLDISCLSSQELPDTSESPYLRRELIWRPPPPSTSSLTDIIHQTEFFLSRLSSSTAPPIPQYQSTVRSDSAHRCTGYHREDVVISSHIRNSYIVHSQAPSLQEICTICDERVEESGHFTCDCGVDDDGFSATVKCGACYAWHHARCVQPIPAGLNLGSQRCTLRSPASELGGQAPQAGAPSVSPSTPSFGQNTVSKVLPADNPDDATDLKPGVSKYQESRLRDRDVRPSWSHHGPYIITEHCQLGANGAIRTPTRSAQVVPRAQRVAG